jgi:probable rRNA maturation factor
VDLGLLNPNRYPEAAARALRPWVEAVVAALAPAAESFAVRFCGDREMRRVNARYRGQDRPTDVLSFPGDGGHAGDVLISVPTARRQARGRARPVERELKVLLLHGLLHCLGHDHETDGGEMEELERRLRRRFLRPGFPRRSPDA